MSIPIVIFLGLYLLIVLFFLVFSFFNIFHAQRYGLATVTNQTTLWLYVVVSLTVLLMSLIYIGQIDWSQVIELPAVNNLSFYDAFKPSTSSAPG
jgi:hypothetical protein